MYTHNEYNNIRPTWVYDVPIANTQNIQKFLPFKSFLQHTLHTRTYIVSATQPSWP